MSYVADTNILLRFSQTNDPEHHLVFQAVTRLRQAGDQSYTTFQNCVEFWNVATRPATARGGYGLSLQAAHTTLQKLKRQFIVLPDPSGAFDEWEKLVIQAKVSGVEVHDARLAATVIAHGISDILTLNESDFHRFPGINAIHPKNVK